MKFLQLFSNAAILLTLFSFGSSASGVLFTPSGVVVVDDEQAAAIEDKKAKPAVGKAETDRHRTEKSNVARKGTKPRSGIATETLSKEDERAAVAFATEHHPALASLVKRLRSRDAEAYGKALRELHGESMRLRRLQDRQPKRFETEISLWKLDSEIRLQLARWAVSDGSSERFEKNIRRLLSRRQEIRRKRLKSEYDRLVARMEQIQEQLNQSPDVQSAAVDQEWMRLTKRFRTSSGAQGSRKKLTKGNSDSSGRDAKPGSKSKGDASKPDRKPSAPSDN